MNQHNLNTNDITGRPLQLLPNRVHRSYQGGKLIEQWQGLPAVADSMQPEEWVASLVEARNSIPIPDEGLSLVQLPDGTARLKDLIEKDDEDYLGTAHVQHYGHIMAVLTKVLDASVRLSIQVHPTKAFSKAFFHSEYGKTEAWYILGGRTINGEPPYVLAGFKPGITRDRWKRYFEEQDIEAMINTLHKFYIQPGDVVLIEGGFPHAIGSGCFLIEIQEPTDYTMRVERTTFDGGTLPDALCHQGLGFEKMLDCFTYETLTEEATRHKCFRQPQLIYQEGGNTVTALISGKDTPCFSMNKLSVHTRLSVNDVSFKTCIVVAGSGWIEANGSRTAIAQGSSYFLPAGLGEMIFIKEGKEPLECVLCYPPSANASI